MLRKLWELWSVFFRLGICTIGGGYVMLPLMRRELVEKLGWVTDEELVDYYAIGQSTPGIIAVNTATFVGYKRCGTLGAVAATVGMVSPSLLVIIIVASCFGQIQDHELVQRAFRGIRIGVSVVLLHTVLGLMRKVCQRPVAIALAAGAFFGVVVLSLSPIAIVIAVALFGLVSGNVLLEHR